MDDQPSREHQRPDGVSDETVEALVAGTEAAYGTESYAALTEARDRAEVAVLAARNTDPTPEES